MEVLIVYVKLDTKDMANLAQVYRNTLLAHYNTMHYTRKRKYGTMEC